MKDAQSSIVNKLQYNLQGQWPCAGDVTGFYQSIKQVNIKVGGDIHDTGLALGTTF